MRTVHDRLRRALDVTREAVVAGQDAPSARRDLLVFCHGFCSALTGHHAGEDRILFPAIVAAHPGLGETLRHLQQDHSMINHLLSGLEAAAERSASPAELRQHLDGIGAIMESHFRYEERALLDVLETLPLDADPSSVLGPL